MIDWTKAEVEFVAGDLSLKATAEKLEVSYSTLSKVAAEGNGPPNGKNTAKALQKNPLHAHAHAMRKSWTGCS